ncbi:Uncharacterised protein [Mycobacteroides abscessus subsp. abscessus]|nr:Uncharacterised protein [Mycobacteroides abscessus subsp. abscessus]
MSPSTPDPLTVSVSHLLDFCTCSRSRAGRSSAALREICSISFSSSYWVVLGSMPW